MPPPPDQARSASTTKAALGGRSGGGAPPHSKARLRLDIITLFPQMFDGPLSLSLAGRAHERGLIDIQFHNLRDYSSDRRRTVDDRPYGGGAGMVLQAEPIFRALRAIRRQKTGKQKARPYVIYLSPQGRRLNQAVAGQLARHSWLILICGHYEGIDERLMRWVDAEVSIGDYVLTGGELPAMVLADAVIRLVPGVVKEIESIQKDSFQEGRLDHPHYTRPSRWRAMRVPRVLLSGNHEQIRQWRFQESMRVTLEKRPDLPAARSRSSVARMVA